ncbi:MAG: hypothetical protein ACOVP8_03565, partial [Phycisphaerales bacterium]
MPASDFIVPHELVCDVPQLFALHLYSEECGVDCVLRTDAAADARNVNSDAGAAAPGTPARYRYTWAAAGG